MIQERTQGYKVCAPTATNRSTVRYRQPVQEDGAMKSRKRNWRKDRHYGPIDLKTWYDGNDREKGTAVAASFYYICDATCGVIITIA